MYRVLIHLCSPISCTIHWLIWREWQALCARAWTRQECGFWRLWVAVFGRNHCEESHEYWTRPDRS